MLLVFCQHCQEQTEHLNINDASAILNISRRTVHRWIVLRRVHMMENAGGRKFVCKMSLLRPCSR